MSDIISTFEELNNTPVVVKTTFKLRRGTTAQWEEKNPILEQGEPGFVYDTNRLKIGDGVKDWKNLPYIVEGTLPPTDAGGIIVVETF